MNASRLSQTKLENMIHIISYLSTHVQYVEMYSKMLYSALYIIQEGARNFLHTINACIVKSLYIGKLPVP